MRRTKKTHRPSPFMKIHSRKRLSPIPETEELHKLPVIIETEYEEIPTTITLKRTQPRKFAGKRKTRKSRK